MTDPQSGWGKPGHHPPASPAPKPGVIPLRPLGLGEILDGAITYIRANPTVTLGLSAVVMTLTQLVQVPASYLYLDSLAQLDQAASGSGADVAGVLSGGLAATLLGAVVNFVAVTLLTGMLIVVLSRAVLGRRTTLQEAWVAARPRLPGLLGLSVLTALLLATALVVGIVPIVLAAVAGAPVWVPVVLGLVTVPAAISLMIYLWVALALAPPGYVLEHIGVLAALSRSRRLVGPQWWRVFGILLLGTVIGAVISGIIGIPFALAAAAIDGAFTTAAAPAPASLTALLIASIGTIIAGTITAPFTAGVAGLLYFDQRIRREAWDLELARAASGGPPTAAGPSLEPAW